MFNIDRILVPTDFSSYADLALKRALDLAKACESENIIQYSGKSPNAILIALDRQILQKLEHRWKAVQVKPQGRSFVVSLTKEGEWFEYILQNPEPARNT